MAGNSAALVLVMVMIMVLGGGALIYMMTQGDSGAADKTTDGDKKTSGGEDEDEYGDGSSGSGGGGSGKTDEPTTPSDPSVSTGTNGDSTQPSGDALPNGIMEGDVVRTPAGAVGKIESGLFRHYPNTEIYGSYGAPPFKQLSEAVWKMLKSGAPFAKNTSTASSTPDLGAEVRYLSTGSCPSGWSSDGLAQFITKKGIATSFPATGTKVNDGWNWHKGTVCKGTKGSTGQDQMFKIGPGNLNGVPYAHGSTIPPSGVSTGGDFGGSGSGYKWAHFNFLPATSTSGYEIDPANGKEYGFFAPTTLTGFETKTIKGHALSMFGLK